MVVLSITNAPNRLKGRLRVYLTEIAAGLFVGNANVRMQKYLWDLIALNIEEGKATFITSSNSEIGFDFKQINEDNYKIVLYENFPLIAKIIKGVEKKEEEHK